MNPLPKETLFFKIFIIIELKKIPTTKTLDMKNSGKDGHTQILEPFALKKKWVNAKDLLITKCFVLRCTHKMVHYPHILRYKI